MNEEYWVHVFFLAAFPLTKEAVTEDYRSEVVKSSNFYMTLERIHRIKEYFHSHGQPLCKFIEPKKVFTLHKKGVQLPRDRFGTPIWPPWRHVKTLYNTKFVWTANYLRILISLGKCCEGYVPDFISPTTKTLKVAAHTRWLMVTWSLSY